MSESRNDTSSQRRALIATGLVSGVAVLIGLGAFWLDSLGQEAMAPEPKASPVAKFRAVAKRRIQPPKALFREVAHEIGVHWQAVNGARGQKRFPESMGVGVAWVDWDNDQDPDLIFNNATGWPDNDDQPQPYAVAAFENDGKGRFRDKTEELGLDFEHYGTGIAAGDVNGDGFTDLFFSALGANRLMLNVQGRGFRDATQEYNVAGETHDYSTCAAFFDADGDGDLDLIVGGYSVWSPEIDQALQTLVPGFGLTYSDPDVFEGQSGRAFRNEGGTHFTEVQDRWGLGNLDPTTSKVIGKNLGFAFDYFNDDRLLDIVVANDRVENLFLMSGPSGYRNQARSAGLAFERRGLPSAAMGIDIDVEPETGERRIVMGNFFDEMTSLYVGNAKSTAYLDESIAEGIGPRTNDRVTFGALFIDYDLDGRRDIIEVNGAIDEVPEDLRSVGVRYAQPGDVFWNCGGACRTRYLFVGREDTGDIGVPIVGRALAAADMDGDGDLDLAATGIGAPGLIYRNETPARHRWLRVKLLGDAPNREAIGAEVFVRTETGTQRRLVQPAVSYFSHNELVQTFGLGKDAATAEVQVAWPNGQRTPWRSFRTNQLVTLHE